MLDTWLWHYSAKKAGIVMIFFAVMASVKLWVLNAFGSLHGLQPGYIMAVSLVGAGTGCALLVYHAQKSGEEDTAAKKKIVLVGTAAVMLVGALIILDILRIL